MKNYVKLNAYKIKQILTSPRGWIAWGLANLITSSPWLIPLIYFLFTNEPEYLALSGSIWTIQMAPLPLETFLNIIITLLIYNLIKKKPL
jgi:hypothetical protein